MQCLSQINVQGLKTASDFKASLQKRNTAWFIIIMSYGESEEKIESFGDIENLTIERFYLNYKNSNGDPLYRVVNLGKWTVDIKLGI